MSYKKLRTISIKLEEDIIDKLQQIAEALGVSRSDLIREAIKNYLNSEKVKAILEAKIMNKLINNATHHNYSN